MKTSELITLAKESTAYDLDAAFGTVNNQTGTDAQWVRYLNWAQRVAARLIEPYSPKITLTLVIGQDTYNLRDITTPVVSKKVVRVHKVVINGTPLLTRAARDYGLWSLDELETFAPTWFSDTTGQSTKAVQQGQNLILHPAPSSLFSSNYIAGTYLPADLVDPSTGTDSTPDLAEECHEAIALMAAVYAADPTVSEAEGIARLQRLSARAHDAIRQVSLDEQNSRSSFEGTLDQNWNRFMPI